jgi:hypothetical protein
MAIQRHLHSVLVKSSVFPMAESRMRVAIAGTNALALLIAHYVVQETSYQLIILSRTVSTWSLLTFADEYCEA